VESQGGTTDFADCLIAARNEEAGCDFTATFDRAALDIPGMNAP
jgi:predicted nucleic-acid-binding protein